MKIDPNGIWYHGSNLILSELREGSTITQWRALAEAFSHKPTMLCCDDDGMIFHNGVQTGYLYAIDEPIEIGTDVYPHPRTTMEENAEFLTRRSLPLKLIQKL